MNSLNVDCGVFYCGDREIGGCLNAVVKIKTITTGKQGNYAVNELDIKAETGQWWLWEDVSQFKAKFYRIRGEQMVKLSELLVKDFAAPIFQQGQLMKQKLILKGP